MKKFKKIIFLALIIILSVINYVAADDIRNYKSDSIIKAFDNTGANLLEANINCNSKICDKYLTMKELQNMAEELIIKLDIKGKRIEKNLRISLSDKNDVEEYYVLDTWESENQRQLIINGKNGTSDVVTVIILTYKDDYNNLEETDLVIDLISNKTDGIESVKMNLEHIYDELNSDIEITTCIVGTYEGKLSDKEKYDKISKFLNSIGGNKVEGMLNESLISVSAYSPDIDRFIYTGNKKMNLNIAMRYNEYEGKTYLWIGTPIITTGY